MPRTRLTGAFERRVARALDRLVATGAPVVVACSGGADSSAALIAIARSGRAVTAAHFDHRLRIRAEADADRAAVDALARDLSVALVCGEGSGASRAEDAARGERYRWLAAVAVEAGLEHVVTGHTLDDQAETVLFRLARGTGLDGAAGMAECAPWPAPGGDGLHLVRPLLGVERRDVEAYVAALGVAPRHDPTNEDPAYSRNRIRGRVLPELRAVNPQAARALAAFAARSAADAQALDGWAARAFGDLASVDGERVTIDRPALRSLPRGVRARVLRMAASPLGVALDGAHLDAIEAVLGRSGATVHLPGATLRTGRTEVTLEPS